MKSVNSKNSNKSLNHSPQLPISQTTDAMNTRGTTFLRIKKKKKEVGVVPFQIHLLFQSLKF